MKSFLTGSRVYGTPKPESDIDLCVLLTYDEIEKLREFSDTKLPASRSPSSVSLRFGKLNIIATDDEKVFAEWRLGTSILEALRTVTKDFAIATFNSIRKMGSVASLHKSEPGPEATLDEWARLTS
jgi:hypothetical protein